MRIAGGVQTAQRVVGVFADTAVGQGFRQQPPERVAPEAGQLPAVAGPLGIGVKLPVRAVMLVK